MNKRRQTLKPLENKGFFCLSLLYRNGTAAASLLIGSGVDIRTVSGRLGHSNTSTTLNIYSHALEELDRKAADVLADVLMKKA
ncbi:MAG: hypothetical protein ACLSEY_15320 [Enterocloster sp.]